MKSTNKGFTILETLVAITILLLAITGPLTIAEKGLTNAVSSQDQLTASYLGQDLMEYVKNVRDDNLLAGNPWLNTIAVSGLSTICAPGNLNPCDFDTEAGNAASPRLASCTNVSNLCRIYLTATGYYTPDSTLGNLTATKFRRDFTVSIPGGASPSTASSSVVTVTVMWNTGNVTNQVVLQDILFNTLR